MRQILTSNEIIALLTTNLQAWKVGANIAEVLKLNSELDQDDLITICSADFYDDINHTDDHWNVLEKHFMDTDLSVYSKAAFILIHDIYNN